MLQVGIVAGSVASMIFDSGAVAIVAVASLYVLLAACCK